MLCQKDLRMAHALAHDSPERHNFLVVMPKMLLVYQGRRLTVLPEDGQAQEVYKKHMVMVVRQLQIVGLVIPVNDLKREREREREINRRQN